MEKSILFPQNLNKWRTELSILLEIFETDQALFGNEAIKIKKILKFLDDVRISIPALSLSKTGKSTLFNALIGCDLLESNTSECTSFACKIRPILSEMTEPRFYRENDPQNVFEGREKIKKRIEELNKETKDNLQIWVLETRMFAFQRDEEKQKIAEILPFVEFVDLPGFDDACLNKKEKEDETVIEKNFKEILDKIDFDGVILCFDVEKPNIEIKKFIKHVKFNLFKRDDKKMAECLTKKRFCAVANKSDKWDFSKKEENIKEIQKLVCFSLNGLVDPNKLKNSISKFNFFSQDQKQLESDFIEVKNHSQKELEIFINEQHLTFVSAKEAVNSVFLTQDFLEQKKREWKEIEEVDEEELERRVNNLAKTIKNRKEYTKSSGFTLCVNRIFSLVNQIYEEKIMNYVEENLKTLNAKKIEFFESKLEALKEETKDHPILKNYQSFYDKIMLENTDNLIQKIKEKIFEHADMIKLLQFDFPVNPKKFKEYHETVMLLDQMIKIFELMHNSSIAVFKNWNKDQIKEISETKLAASLQNKFNDFEAKSSQMMNESFQYFKTKILLKGVSPSYFRCLFLYVFKYLISEKDKNKFINHVGNFENTYKPITWKLHEKWINFLKDYYRDLDQVLSAYAKINEIQLKKPEKQI